MPLGVGNVKWRTGTQNDHKISFVPLPKRTASLFLKVRLQDGYHPSAAHTASDKALDPSRLNEQETDRKDWVPFVQQCAKLDRVCFVLIHGLASIAESRSRRISCFTVSPFHRRLQNHQSHHL